MKRFTMLPIMAGIFLCASLAALAQSAATPTFNANGGNFVTSVSVQITSATVGSTIHYTTDGSTPTGSSPSIASGSSISLTSSSIVKAIARKSGLGDSSVATSNGYYHYSVSGNQHYFYGNWPDPLFDTKMNAIRADQVTFGGTQHFNFSSGTTIETKGARSGLRVLSNWKFHGNGATLKLSTNTPLVGAETFINTYVIGVASAGTGVGDEVDNVLIEDFDINCNYDQISPSGGNAMIRGVLLIGTQNEVLNCTVRQPVGRHSSGVGASETFAIDLRAAYKDSWDNLISSCVVTNYRGGSSSWVNGIAMSASGGFTLVGRVESCKVYGNGNGTDYGYNAQGDVSVVFDGNESHNMNRGFNNDTGNGYDIEWANSVFHVPANAIGMHIRASQDGLASFNEFYLNGADANAIALAGAYGGQPGATNWVFDSNWIERTGNYLNCRGVVFGPFPWDGTKPAPSHIGLYDNRIDLNITNLVSGGTNSIFSGNTGLNGSGTPQGF